jgi:hypothetical protein
MVARGKADEKTVIAQEDAEARQRKRADDQSCVDGEADGGGEARC